MPVNIGPKIGIEGEKEYRQSINQIITQAKTLSSEMKKLESSFNSEGKSLSENSAKRKLLNEQINVQKQRVEELSSMLDKSKEKFGENAAETMKWQQAVNNATTELNELQSALKDTPNSLQLIGQNMQDVGAKWKNVGAGIQNVGKGLTTHVTAPIIGAFAAATKSSIDWETAFTGVMKTVDASAEEYDQLAENIKKMATETASSKEDIAGVMEIAGQLGVSGVDNLTTFTKTMVELGDTTNLSAEDAATALARFMNITGESTLNVDKIGSSIVDLGNNFATSESEITEMATRLASAGTLAGMSSTDILALSAAMSSVGIQAEAGGTAMTQTLTSIEAAVSAFRDGSVEDLEAIADIAGLSANDFALAWENHPIGAVQDFIQGLGELDEKGESATLVLGEIGMSGIRQSNMLKSLSLASEMLGDAIETSSAAYEENNALQNEAAKRYETTASKNSQAKEQITNLAVEVGERFVPYVQKALTVVDGLVQKWDSLDQSQQDSIIKFGLLAAAIGPIVTGIGSLVIGIGSFISAGGVIIGAIGSAIPVIATIGTTIAGVAGAAVAALPGVIAFLAPFAPFIAIGAAVVAAGVLIYKNWDTIKETAINVGTKIGEAWNGIKTKTMDVWNNVKSKTTEAWNGVKNTITSVGSNIVSNTSASLGRIKSAFQENGGGIKGVVAAGWQGIKEYYSAGFKVLNTLTGGKLAEIKKAFTDKFTELKNNALTWAHDMMSNFIQGIKDKFEELKNAASEYIANPLKAIAGHSHPTEGPMADDYKWMPDMMKLFASGIKNNAYLVRSAMDDVATDISVGMGGYQSTIADNSIGQTTLNAGLDVNAVYAAVKQGAADATVSISLDGRELKRTLDEMGVMFA